MSIPSLALTFCDIQCKFNTENDQKIDDKMNLLKTFSIFTFTIFSTSAITFAQQANVNLDWNPQKNTENLVPYGGNVVSPDVKDDHTITFRLKAPDAHEVKLTGGPILLALGVKDPVPFKKGDDGIWSLTVGPVKPNIYVYRFLLDGVAIVDPNNTITGASNQPGYSSVVVHGNGPAYYDAKNVAHGNITRSIYHSDVLNGEREIFVYTPPGYDPKKKYPVLYLLGGSGELASGWMLDGRANFIADNLLAESRIVPMIIAMPNNQVLHRNDPNHIEKTYTLFEKELRSQIVPFVDKNYSTIKDRKSRAISGLSMGGRHTQIVGMNDLDLFSSFGILSAGDLETEKLNAAFFNDPKVKEKVDYLLIGHGSAEVDFVEKRSAATHEALEKHGIKHDYFIGGDGAHDWGTWRMLLNDKLLPNLWKKK
ncbi:esterase [Dyadobacter sp. CY356]|uniref:esterase n=1 Tax=Dyadobacter sp. CY356 TaxID=2906442 RepID=UPI001EEABF3A|nr:esterase [Dyadobacter sp. CY356]MCF0055873.1 esterase [Dyadobacter sp. CY356]